MRRLLPIALTLFLTLTARPLLAQAPGVTPTAPAEPKAVTPDDMRAPTSPAFALLDVSPSSVERPQTPKAFTVNLISALRGSDGLPRSYAVEVAPFWLTSHPDLTFDGYYHASVVQTMQQTVTVSLATTPLAGASADQTFGSSLGVGVRTLLRAGNPHPQLQASVDELLAATAAIATEQDATVPLEDERDRLRDAGQTAAADEVQRRIDALEASLPKRLAEHDRKRRAAALRIQALDKERVGFVMAVAVAEAWDFPQDRYDQHRIARWGAWATPGYRALVCGAKPGDCTSTLDVLVVARVLQDRRTSTDTLRDVGARVAWQPVPAFSLSFETVRRSGGTATKTTPDASARTVGGFEYRLENGMLLYGSFGKNFENVPGGHTLVSLFGLNVGFGKKPDLKIAPAAPTP